MTGVISLQNEALSAENRADIVTARESVRRAANGHEDVDHGAVITMLVRVLQSTCPHDPAGYLPSSLSSRRGTDDRVQIISPACNAAGVER